MNHNSLGCKQPYITQAQMLKMKVTQCTGHLIVHVTHVSYTCTDVRGHSPWLHPGCWVLQNAHILCEETCADTHLPPCSAEEIEVYTKISIAGTMKIVFIQRCPYSGVKLDTKVLASDWNKCLSEVPLYMQCVNLGKFLSSQRWPLSIKRGRHGIF